MACTCNGPAIIGEHFTDCAETAAPAKTSPRGVMWVCDDCMFEHANGEHSPDRPADLPEVWSKEPDTEVTMGMLWDAPEHSCGLEPAEIERRFREDAEECNCTEREFSTWDCDGCGDTHHGRRHAFTWWA